MRRLVVGTAGHIDHGKTKLVEALTGIDCDRWAEEKARGITIDIGFAHLTEGDLQVGFVDVPGHERFVHNALAGLGGIRLMLLVLAADEGAKPQTLEHLAICSLLGIPGGLVALTKSDLASPDLLEVAELEVAELLDGTPFAGAPIVPVSVMTGEGLDILRGKLLELAGELALAAGIPDEPARLPIDRAFHLKGQGVVVTGTLAGGGMRTGDELELTPGGRRVRVRSVQVHGSDREEAARGERVALQLAGIDLGAVARGMQLVEPGALAETRRLALRVHLLGTAPRPLRGWSSVRFHLLSHEVQARLRPLASEEIRPGDSGLAEVRLAEALVAVRGDRVILRRPSPAATLGGGEVVDPAWVPLRGRRRQTALAALEGDETALVLSWIDRAGLGGVGAGELARRLGRRPTGVEPLLEELTAAGRLFELPGAGSRERRWLAPGHLQALEGRLRRALEAHFKERRLSLGMPKAEVVSRLFPGRAGEVAEALLARLADAGAVRLEENRVTLPDRASAPGGEDSALARALIERFERARLDPPAPGELQAELEVKPQILRGVLDYLVDSGRLVRLSSGLLVSSAAVDAVRRELAATGWEELTVAQFKELFGLTRKWAIPLLEHLDSIGATRRLGERRQIVRSRIAADDLHSTPTGRSS